MSTTGISRNTEIPQITEVALGLSNSFFFDGNFGAAYWGCLDLEVFPILILVFWDSLPLVMLSSLFLFYTNNGHDLNTIGVFLIDNTNGNLHYRLPRPLSSLNLIRH